MSQRDEVAPIRSRRKRDHRVPLPVTLKWRGGPEAWVEIDARGARLRVRGDTTIAEVVLRLNGHA
jgi:hypothetical protein